VLVSRRYLKTALPQQEKNHSQKSRRTPISILQQVARRQRGDYFDNTRKFLFVEQNSRAAYWRRIWRCRAEVWLQCDWWGGLRVQRFGSVHIIWKRVLWKSHLCFKTFKQNSKSRSKAETKCSEKSVPPFFFEWALVQANQVTCRLSQRRRSKSRSGSGGRGTRRRWWGWRWGGPK